MSADKSMLVTGASSGFGLLIACTFLEEGYTVFATMRDPDERNASAAQEIRDHAANSRGTAHVLDLDVTSDASVDAAVAKALETVDRLDVVVNNAGIGSGGWAETYTAEQFQRIFDVNVFGVQRVNRAVLPSMREAASGLVVHVSSVMGRLVIPFSAPYTASKWALEGMVESYAIELAGTGVDVALVLPGGFPTGMGERRVAPGDGERRQSYGERKDLPEKMWGGFVELMTGDASPDPQIVADAVLDLAQRPAGERPLRTVVDPLMGGAAVEAINAKCNEVQTELLANLGLGAGDAASA